MRPARGRPPRPTIICLREDLGYAKLPPATEPLDRLDHILVRKARDVCRTDPPTSRPIAEIDDRMLWKVKIERWRGAVLIDAYDRWIVAAGFRMAGDPDDFYRDLGESARRWRADHNRTHTPPLRTDTCTDPLLPTANDRDRLDLEVAARTVDLLREGVRDLTVTAARTGNEAQDELASCSVAILVHRGDLGEVYVGIRVVGSVDPHVHAVILDAVPAVADRAGWFLDEHPGRPADDGELIWSNILDPAQLDALL